MGYLRDIELAAVNMEDLKDALADLKNIALKGDVTDDDFDSVASDYGLNPILVKTKFKASYGDASSIQNMAKATDAKTHISDKSSREIDAACKRYGVPRNRVVEVTYKGKSVTVICRTRSNSVIGVDNDDGNLYKWNVHAAKEMKLKQPIQDSSKD